DSNDGYETSDSSDTVENTTIFPDNDYTPSRPTRGFPTISSISSSVSNMFGKSQTDQQ
ncbi:hypothetical protein RhiirC2_752002, partial [Rhizophagus irregularis]